MSATEAAAASSTPVVDKSDDHAGAHDVKLTPVLAFKYVASLGLMVFSMILVGALIFTENTRVAKEASPWVSLIVLVSSHEAGTTSCRGGPEASSGRWIATESGLRSTLRLLRP